MVGSWSEWSCGAVVGRQGGVDLVADVGEDGFVAAVQVQGGGGADVDDRGDRVAEDEFVQVCAAVLGVFPQALHHGTDESDDRLQRALSDGGVRGGEAYVMAAANFSFCTMISNSAFVDAYR